VVTQIGAGLRPCARGPAVPSSFEEVVEELGLSPEEYETSPALKAWVRKNKNQKYVPPELLERWGLRVDTNFS
jgi:hypothetical protein